ncbi:MAG: hypothetical protein QXJ27_01310, partial [Thermoplasmata archaeon]
LPPPFFISLLTHVQKEAKEGNKIFYIPECWGWLKPERTNHEDRGKASDLHTFRSPVREVSQLAVVPFFTIFLFALGAVVRKKQK